MTTEWVLVPREPTGAMVLAAFDAITNASGEGMIRARWRCMLDAAPAAPQQAEPAVWVRPDQLKQASQGRFLCSLGAKQLADDMVPLYLHPPAEVQRMRDVGMDNLN